MLLSSKTCLLWLYNNNSMWIIKILRSYVILVRKKPSLFGKVWENHIFKHKSSQRKTMRIKWNVSEFFPSKSVRTLLEDKCNLMFLWLWLKTKVTSPPYKIKNLHIQKTNVILNWVLVRFMLLTWTLAVVLLPLAWF